MVVSGHANVSSTTSDVTKKRNHLVPPKQPARTTSTTPELLSLVLCHLSGDTLKAEAFRQQLQQSWRHHGGQEQGSSTQATWQSGNYTVVRGILIPFVPL